MKNDYGDYITACSVLAREVGAVLMDFWRRSFELKAVKKADGTPCTEADIMAHQMMSEGLSHITPQWPVLSEEGACPDFSERCQWSRYWLIDPLDGTRGFLAHSEQFSVNIALIEDHVPILGIIYAPVSETCYFAFRGRGAFKQIGNQAPEKMASSSFQKHHAWRIMLGQHSKRKRLEQLIHNDFPYQFVPVNSSLKFGYLSEGAGDLYPRFGLLSEWDTAAGQCILIESGGQVVDLQGRTLQYNRKASLLNPDFIAIADSHWVKHWLDILNRRI